MTHSSRVARILAIALLAGGTAVAARAGSNVQGTFDFGLGGIRTSPEAIGGVLGGTLGLELRLDRPGHAVAPQLVVRWGSGSFGSISEWLGGNAEPGTQGISTLLVGAEVAPPRDPRGPFLDLGLGLGRSTVRDARYTPGIVPTDGLSHAVAVSGSRTGLAYGGAIGMRFGSLAGGQPVRLALRATGLARDATSSYAHTIQLTLGFPF